MYVSVVYINTYCHANTLYYLCCAYVPSGKFVEKEERVPIRQAIVGMCITIPFILE